MAVELHGYQYSVYSWIARLALREKRILFDWVEIDPFVDNVPVTYLELHPFKRVPVFCHGSFVIYETAAITRYVDEAFDGPKLQRLVPTERARTHQIISIIDSYGYWPLVRQVYSHDVFRPRMGRNADENEVLRGLKAAPLILRAIETLAIGGDYLTGDGLSLADIHLAPMIGYFTMSSRGKALLEQHARLSRWWAAMSQREAFEKTLPKLPALSA